MKKLIISLLLTGTFILYAFAARRSNTPASQNSSGTGDGPFVIPTPASSGQILGSASSTRRSSRYRDGQYTGTTVDAYYGYVQVRAVVSAGRLSDVQILSYPNDRGHSIELNALALPLLTQEAVRAQSANVDTVSGATATSEAFQQSLAAALALAA